MYKLFRYIYRFYFVILFILGGQDLYSQMYSSRDNYTGDWETPETWNPVWPVPLTVDDTHDFLINGYVTVNGPLTLSGTNQDLIINDTLVILGDFLLANKNSVIINNAGVLIVRGDLIIDNMSNIITNNYVVVTGDFIKNGATTFGSFYSNTNPEKVFIDGTILPASLTDNNLLYSAFNCTSPGTTVFPNSGCGYGNSEDLKNDPIFSFLESTCPIYFSQVMASGPLTFCSGDSVTLSAGEYDTYLWSNGMADQNVKITESGSYTLKVINSLGCESNPSDPLIVTVNPLPAKPIITSDGPIEFCEGDSVKLTSVEATSYLWSNGETTQSINVSTAETFTVRVTDSNGCESNPSDPLIVAVNPLPAAPIITPGGPIEFCDGESVNLTSGEARSYLWSNGETTQTINVSTEETYTVKVSDSKGCESISAEITVIVNDLPRVDITSSENQMCSDEGRALSALPAGGTFTLAEGPGLLLNDILTATGDGTIVVEYSYTNVCTNKARQSIIAYAKPDVMPGDDQELKSTSETYMNAELASGETGVWSIVSGRANIADINSPITRVTDLALGENIFLWKVENGNCEDNAQMKIIVYELFVPSAITPNSDGKNDYFILGNYSGKVELIIVNKWGSEEFRMIDYQNDWDGVNKQGEQLPNDTYFYILIFENGTVTKGSVLIKR